MANEISLTVSLSAYKPSVMAQAVGRALQSALFNMTGNFFIGPTCVSIATSATAIPLGQVTQPHWSWFHNLDATNYVTIRNGSGGADLLQIFPGEAFPVPLLTTSVPYAVANTAAVLLEYMIIGL